MWRGVGRRGKRRKLDNGREDTEKRREEGEE